MNNARYPKLVTALLIASALSLAACQKGAEQPPLAGAGIGGPFTLTDQDGRKVSDGRFAGRYRMMFFGYTYCPDVCPTTLQKLIAGLDKFARQDPARAGKVQPIFVSIDPRRDTPAVLKAYVSAFSPRLIGLTGSDAEIADVAKQFAVFYRSGETKGAGGYLVDHSSTPMLFGPDGAPIALLAADQGADAVAADLDRWVK